MPSDVELSAFEAYLLEMASWVHDIGMQAVSAPDALHPTFPSDPNDVRKNHAQESFNFLMDDSPTAFKLGLPSNYDSTIQFIAWLALAHGTATYKEAVEQLEGVTRLNERDVRGPLLASLVLMADELDLHAERAAPHGAIEELGDVSDAHWLKHECVDDVAVSIRDSGEGDRVHFAITLKPFKGMTPTQFGAVKAWIRDKLQEQIALVEHEVTIGFRNHFVYDRDVEIVRSKLGGRGNPRLRESVIAVMVADNARATLINHNDCHSKVRRALDADQSVVVVGEDVGVREDGREDIFTLVCAEQRAAGKAVWIGADSSALPAPPKASDVLGSWLVDAGMDPGDGTDEHENERRARLLAVLEGVVRDRGSSLLAISSFDSLSEDDRDWLIGTAMVRLDHVTWLLTSSRALSGLPTGASDAGWQQVTVGGTPRDALKVRLSRFVNEKTAEKMVAAGATYSTVRRFGVFGDV